MKYDRQKIWRHNSFLGHARMMEMNLRNIIDADTTTDQTKFTARKILADVEHLKLSLKTRRDQE